MSEETIATLIFFIVLSFHSWSMFREGKRHEREAQIRRDIERDQDERIARGMAAMSEDIKNYIQSLRIKQDDDCKEGGGI